MGVYLYAVCEAGTAELPADAAPRERLRLVVADGLAALVSDDREASPSPSVDELWEHEQVVEALMGRCDLLPARYGSELEDSASVERLLHSRHHELAAGLRRVGGAVELAVRGQLVSAPDRADFVDSAAAGSGTAYMAAALAREHRARALAQHIHAVLERLARAGATRPTQRPVLGCAGAYLVSRPGVGAFQDAIERLDEELGDAEITCTGPWPPYSFSTAPEEGSA
jgi:hypothetical protein